MTPSHSVHSKLSGFGGLSPHVCATFESSPWPLFGLLACKLSQSPLWLAQHLSVIATVSVFLAMHSSLKTLDIAVFPLPEIFVQKSLHWDRGIVFLSDYYCSCNLGSNTWSPKKLELNSEHRSQEWPLSTDGVPPPTTKKTKSYLTKVPLITLSTARATYPLPHVCFIFLRSSNITSDHPHVTLLPAFLLRK